MMQVWIIGAGKFGLGAVDRLTRHDSNIVITLVDPEFNRRAAEVQSVKRVCGDGIAFLVDHLNDGDSPDWIVPAMPFHVAYEWIRKKIKPSYRVKSIDIPDEISSTVPNPVAGSDGVLYMSNADFICPEDCPESEGVCTCTGEPRPMILHEFLAHRNLKGYRSIVVQSHQLAPGVGGYSPRSLYGALNDVIQSEQPVVLSTACKCHGVMHAFEIRKQ